MSDFILDSPIGNNASSQVPPIDFRAALNDEQFAAVTAEPGPLLVLAGAGTTFLPTQLADAARRLGATVRPTSPKLQRTIVLVHRPEAIGPAAQRFIALVL